MNLPTTIPSHVLPHPTALANSRAALYTTLPSPHLGLASLSTHLHALTPGFSSSSTSPRYYGFVTGGSTPAALLADHLVSTHDQNVQVHLPDESIATDVEFHALRMLEELFGFERGQWGHKTFTTGATASNVMGLAMGREAVVARAGERTGRGGVSVAGLGVLGAAREAGVEGIKVFGSGVHSSLRKACAVVGLGHGCVVDVGRDGEGHRLDVARMREGLGEARRKGEVGIVVVSCGEVNTGLFATNGKEEMRSIREVADEFGAWVHVDAAFGLMARVLPEGDEFARVRKGVEGIELADSIAGDAHKLLNVPYESGFFFSKSLYIAQQVFQNPGAVYLASDAAEIPSPLNLGLENSRRFRALPVYANLVAYGKEGYADMIVRQTRFARRIAKYLDESDAYELLPSRTSSIGFENIYIIVLFRAKDATLNESLVKKINEKRLIYCSGTKWDGQPAVRFAVANWQVLEERDWPVVKAALEEALR